MNHKAANERLAKNLKRFKNLPVYSKDAKALDEKSLNNIQALIYKKMHEHAPSFDLNNPPSFKDDKDGQHESNNSLANEFNNLLESYLDFVTNPRTIHTSPTIEALEKNEEFLLINYIVSSRARNQHDICDVSVKQNSLKAVLAKAEEPYVKVNLEQQFDILMDVALGLRHLGKYLKESDDKDPRHANGERPHKICEKAVREILALARIKDNVDIDEFFDRDLTDENKYKTLKDTFVNHKESADSKNIQKIKLDLQIPGAVSPALQKYLTNFLKRNDTLRFLEESAKENVSQNEKKDRKNKHDDMKKIFDVDNASDYSIYVERSLYDLIDKCFDRDDVRTLVEVNPRLFAFRKACENLKQSSQTHVMTSQTIKFLREQISGYVNIKEQSVLSDMIASWAVERSYAKKMFKNLVNSRDDVEVAHLTVAAAQLRGDNPVIKPNPNAKTPVVHFSPKVHQRKTAAAPKNKAIQNSYVDDKKTSVEHFRRENKLDLFQNQMQLADMMLGLFERPLCKVNGQDRSIMEWSAMDEIGNESLHSRLKQLKDAMIEIKVGLATGDASDIRESNLSKMDDSQYQSQVTERLRKIKDKDVNKMQESLNHALNALVNSVYKDSPKAVDQIIIAAAQTQSLIQARYGMEDFTRTLVRDEMVDKFVSNEKFDAKESWLGWASQKVDLAKAAIKSSVEYRVFDGICTHSNIFLDVTSERSTIENVKSIFTSDNQVVSDSLQSFKKIVESSQTPENFEVSSYEAIYKGKQGLIDRLTHNEQPSRLYRFARSTFDIFVGLLAPISIIFGKVFSNNEQDSKAYESSIFYDDGKHAKLDKQAMIQRETIATILDLEYEQEYNVLKSSKQLLSALIKHKTPDVDHALVKELESCVVAGDDKESLARFKLLAIQKAFKSLDKYAPTSQEHIHNDFMETFKVTHKHFFDDSKYESLISSKDFRKMEEFISNGTLVLAELNANQYHFDSNDLYDNLRQKIDRVVAQIKPEDHYEITALEILKYVSSAPKMLQRIKLGVATLPHVVAFSYEMSSHYQRFFGFMKSVAKTFNAQELYKKIDTVSSFRSALRHYIYEQSEFDKDLGMIDKFVDNFNNQPARVVPNKQDAQVLPSKTTMTILAPLSTARNVASSVVSWGYSWFSSTPEQSAEVESEANKPKEEDSGFFLEKLQNQYCQMTYELGRDVKRVLQVLNKDHSKDRALADLESALEGNEKVMKHFASNSYLKRIVAKIKNNQTLTHEEEYQYKRFKDMRLHLVVQIQEILYSLYQKFFDQQNKGMHVSGDELNFLMLLRYANNSLMSSTNLIQKGLDGDAMLSSGQNIKAKSKSAKDTAVHMVIDSISDKILHGYSDNSAGAAVSAFKSFAKDFEKAHKNINPQMGPE